MSLTASVYSAARVAHMLPRGSRSPDRLSRPSPASTRPLHAHSVLNDLQMSVTRPGPHRKGRRDGVSSAARSPRRGDTLELLRISNTHVYSVRFNLGRQAGLAAHSVVRSRALRAARRGGAVLAVVSVRAVVCSFTPMGTARREGAVRRDGVVLFR